jgi:2-alkyl-3-oxoalkanoate reductase
MKVLVTGGTGFLGWHLVHRLVDSGDFVRVLVRPSSTKDARGDIVDGIRATGSEVVIGDLKDEPSLRRAVESVEAICHCAAHMQTRSPWSKFEEVTIRGTERLLQAALQERVSRFLHVSSIGVCGVDGRETVTEESPIDHSPGSRGHYTRSKIESEKLVWRYYRKHNLPITVIRPGILYGPGRPPFVARFSLPIGPKLRIAVGRPQQRLPLAFVENVAEGIHLALHCNRAIGKAYNLVDEPVFQKEYLALLRRVDPNKVCTILLSPALFYPVLSLFEQFCRWMGINPPVSRHQLKRALASILYDTSRAREELGWFPRVGVVEGLTKIRASMGHGFQVSKPNSVTRVLDFICRQHSTR